MHLSQAAWATLTEHHRLGLKLQTFLPHSSASWKSRIKDLVRTLFLACGQPPSHCVLMWSFLYADMERASSDVSSSSYKDMNPIKSD